MNLYLIVNFSGNGFDVILPGKSGPVYVRAEELEDAREKATQLCPDFIDSLNVLKMEDLDPPRFVNGFEVEDGWVMPEPPVPGMRPCVVFHGSDGLGFFWWDPAKSEFPRRHAELYDCCPFVDPDTGGEGYKECARAFEELGFEVM